MIFGIGIDIIEKNRIKKSIKKYKKKINKKIGCIESKSKNKNLENIAKTFTLKESIVKSIGTGFTNKIFLKNIKIKKNKNKKNIIKKKIKTKILTTLSHEKKYTITLSVIINFL